MAAYAHITKIKDNKWHLRVTSDIRGQDVLVQVRPVTKAQAREFAKAENAQPWNF